jgi:hypothetical protein
MDPPENREAVLEALAGAKGSKSRDRKSTVADTSMGPNTGMLSGVPSRLASHTSASSSRSEAAKII